MIGSEPYSPGGQRVEGPYENQRNAQSADLFKAIIKEAKGVTDVIIAHHLVCVVSEEGKDHFTYTIVQEIPSADTLIFDHDIMSTIFGVSYKEVMKELACEPVESRDKLLRKLYNMRNGKLT